MYENVRNDYTTEYNINCFVLMSKMKEKSKYTYDKNNMIEKIKSEEKLLLKIMIMGGMRMRMRM